MSSCQLKITPELRLGVCFHSPSQRWILIWLRLVRALCMLLQPLGVHTCTSLFLPRFVSMVHSIPFGSYNLLPPLPQSCRNPEKKDLMETSFLWWNVLRSSTLPFVQVRVSVVFLIYCRRKLLWWCLSKTLTYEHSKMLLGIILLTRYFRRTVEFGCFPSPLSI